MPIPPSSRARDIFSKGFHRIIGQNLFSLRGEFPKQHSPDLSFGLMILRSMVDVEESFSDNSDDMRVADCKSFVRSNVKREYSSQIDPAGRVLFTAEAHRSDGKRFTVSADGKLKAFLDLDSQRSMQTGSQRQFTRGRFDPWPDRLE